MHSGSPFARLDASAGARRGPGCDRDHLDEFIFDHLPSAQALFQLSVVGSSVGLLRLSVPPALQLRFRYPSVKPGQSFLSSRTKLRSVTRRHEQDGTSRSGEILLTHRDYIPFSLLLKPELKRTLQHETRSRLTLHQYCHQYHHRKSW